MPSIFDFAYQLHGRGGHEITYHASDVDESAATKYYGFLNIDGGWLIIQHNTATGAIRYVQGESGYTTAWAAKAELDYVYYDALC